MTQAEAEQPFGRPKEELPDGLGQEVRAHCTGEGHQITDMLSLLAPTSTHGSELRRSRLAQRQGDGSNDPPPRKRLVGGQANEPSPCSGTHLLEALPPPGTSEPAVVPG